MCIRDRLKRPGLIKKTERVEIGEIRLTGRGRSLLSELPEEGTSLLTPELLRWGRWRGVKFEPYDLEAPSYKAFPGRRHPLREVIEEVREIFVSLGFEEVEEPLVQLAFWNFDALFQPQDHPARDMQDTFYIEGTLEDSLEEEIVRNVKLTHENGWTTGSRGWGGCWSIEEARKLVLRTHTTAVTVKALYENGDRPRRVFTIGSVFRNEKMDYKHSVEFHQVDGIVVEERANIRQLMGILTEFYRRLGMKRVKFMPSYFPYTEPSIQTSVYVEKLGDWVELAGMGIFRPEVTRPLGVTWPVLAWGCGIERIVMIRYDVEDIREFYRSDLGFLRRIPMRKPFG